MKKSMYSFLLVYATITQTLFGSQLSALHEHLTTLNAALPATIPQVAPGAIKDIFVIKNYRSIEKILEQYRKQNIPTNAKVFYRSAIAVVYQKEYAIVLVNPLMKTRTGLAFNFVVKNNSSELAENAAVLFKENKGLSLYLKGLPAYYVYVAALDKNRYMFNITFILDLNDAIHWAGLKLTVPPKMVPENVHGQKAQELLKAKYKYEFFSIDKKQLEEIFKKNPKFTTPIELPTANAVLAPSFAETLRCYFYPDQCQVKG